MYLISPDPRFQPQTSRFRVERVTARPIGWSKNCVRLLEHVVQTKLISADHLLKPSNIIE